MSEALVKGLRLGSASNPLVVTLTQWEGHRLLDIRKHFVDKKSQEIKPTRKGVSLNANTARQVQEVLNEHKEAIFAWLETGDNSALGAVEQAMKARSQATEAEALKPRRFKVQQREWKGAEFFECEANGADDHIVLNQSHPFFKSKTGDKKTKSSNDGSLVLMLAAYYRAKLRFSGEIEADAEQFFRLFEHEWGLLLKNYCENEKAVHG